MSFYKCSGEHYLFVITFGRSGSTLLQRMLNSHSDFLIRGENHALPMRLFGGLANMKQTIAEFGDRHDDATHPFFGLSTFKQPHLDEIFGQFLDRIIINNNTGARIVGYKEIRYGPDFVDLSSYLYYLTYLLPKVTFVFLYRNPEDAAKSGWWRHQTNAVEYLTDYISMMRSVQSEHNINSIEIHYEDIIDDVSALHSIEAATDRKFNYNVLKKISSKSIGI